VLVRDPLRIELDKVTSRMTALHIAAKNGKPELVALLLQQGADFK
jgi:ankyrin repeat protein